MECTIPPYSVKKSVGYTFIPDDKIDYEEIIKTADKALYTAKQKKNCAVFSSIFWYPKPLLSEKPPGKSFILILYMLKWNISYQVRGFTDV